MRLYRGLRGFLWLMVGLTLPLASVQAYTVSVPVADKRIQTRQEALRGALKKVIQQTNGQHIVCDNIIANLQMTDYVMAYRYIQPAGDTGVRLVVDIDSRALAQALARKGVHWHGVAQTPSVMGWLMVEADDTRFVLTPSETYPLAKILMGEVKSMARQHDHRFLLPLMDLADLKHIDRADIWAQFRQPLKLASSRYHANVIVTARIYPASPDGQWRGDWQLLYEQAEPLTWHVTSTAAIDVMRQGLSTLYAHLAELNTPIVERPVDALAHLKLNISNVTNAQAFAHIRHHLERLSMVQSMNVQEIALPHLIVQLDVEATPQRFLHAIKMAGILQVDESTGLHEGKLDLRYRAQ